MDRATDWGPHSEAVPVWAVTAYIKVGVGAKEDRQPLPLITLLRQDGGKAGGVVVYPSGRLGIRLVGGADGAVWPVAWQDPLWRFGEHPGVYLHRRQWHIVTLSVELPSSVRVYLDGELVWQLDPSCSSSDPGAAAAFSAALEPGGALSFDPRAGFELFGDDAAGVGDSKAGNCLRAVPNRADRWVGC